MKAQVTSDGLIVPKNMLKGVQEVDIRKEGDLIFIVPLSSNDPINQLGKSPITDEINDASEHHDNYIYQR